MKELIKKILGKVPGFSGLFGRWRELEARNADLNRKIAALTIRLNRMSGAEARAALAGEGMFDPRAIDICAAMPVTDNESWGDLHYATSLKKEFERRGYRVRIRPLELWYDASDARTVIVLRGITPYFPVILRGRTYILWNISHPGAVSVEECDMYDHVFFASRKMVEEMGPRLKVPCSLLLQCTDPEVMACAGGAKTEELLFVGNSRRVFRPILRDLLPTRHKLTVYGTLWEGTPVEPYVVDTYLDNRKVGQAYHDAKIVLNDHWADMVKHGVVNNRIFDALAAGGFVISDAMPEIDEIFGGNVVTYEGREDLAEKVERYLRDDKAREEKARKGREIVLKAHTFKNRVDEIVKVLEK